MKEKIIVSIVSILMFISLLCSSGCSKSDSELIPSTELIIVPIPVTTSATNSTANSFSANWEALKAIDSCYLDVSEKMDFTTKIAGYNPKVIKGSALTSQVVSGLAAGKTYYYRLQAWVKGKQGAFSNIQSVTTVAERVTLVDNQGLFGQYIVSHEEFNLWNTLDMSGAEVTGLMKQASKEIYKTWPDKFDFIVFVLNNTSNPDNKPSAQAIPLRNTVKGLGFSDKLNEAIDYGSPSQLQAVSIIYKIQFSATSTNSSIITGPILHELAHRWMNFGLNEKSDPSGGIPHWPSYTVDGNKTDLTNGGIFASPTNNYAPIELYLMGLIDGSEITDATNKALYDKIIAAQGIRIPSKANSQKDFKAIIVVVTPQALTSQQIATTNSGVTGLTNKVLTGSGVNFYRQTGGRGTLSCTLNDVKK